MHILFYLAFTFTVFCTALLVLAPLLLRHSAEVQRVLDVAANNRRERRTAVADATFRERLLHLSHSVRSTLGLSENVKLTQRLAIAGIRGKGAADAFFAAQFLSPLLGAFAGSFISGNTVFWVLALAVAGYMAPDFWLTRQTGKRKKKIQRSMPDAIDLLVICVDAGLGLDQALLRVGQELALSHREINEEFTQVNLAQRAGQPRLEAWQNLATKTKIEEFVAFTGMLTQTDRFGTPVTKALSRFSEDLRLKRRQKAEEAASKTKVKIIFPLVLCIFPCIFIVLLAPAMLNIAAGLKGIGN